MTVKSVDDIQKDIVNEFREAGDWLETYALIVRKGRELRSLEPDERRSDHALPGCQSNVWLKVSMQEGRIRLQADSDALITKGILSLLIRVYDRQRPADVLDAKLHFLDDIGLSTNLSPSRRDGLTGIVRRIREVAAANTRTP
jgi:cysteine desulfuration protein SufE